MRTPMRSDLRAMLDMVEALNPAKNDLVISLVLHLPDGICFQAKHVEIDGAHLYASDDSDWHMLCVPIESLRAIRIQANSVRCRAQNIEPQFQEVLKASRKKQQRRAA